MLISILVPHLDYSIMGNHAPISQVHQNCFEIKFSRRPKFFNTKGDIFLQNKHLCTKSHRLSCANSIQKHLLTAKRI